MREMKYGLSSVRNKLTKDYLAYPQISLHKEHILAYLSLSDKYKFILVTRYNVRSTKILLISAKRIEFFIHGIHIIYTHYMSVLKAVYLPIGSIVYLPVW